MFIEKCFYLSFSVNRFLIIIKKHRRPIIINTRTYNNINTIYKGSLHQQQNVFT